MKDYYYLVDELENDGKCFTSIQEIKEAVENHNTKHKYANERLELGL